MKHALILLAAVAAFAQAPPKLQVIDSGGNLRMVVCDTCGSTSAITINLNDTAQTIVGWHTQERVWDDPHLTETFTPCPGPVPPCVNGEPFGRSAVVIPAAAQADILNKMYGDGGLKLTHLTPLVDRSESLELRWKLNQSHIDFVKQAIPFGLQVWVPVFFRPLNMASASADAFAEYVMVHLREWKDQNVEPQFVDAINEPDVGSTPEGCTPQYYHDLVVSLGQKLANEGFRTKIIGPSTTAAGNALAYLQNDPSLKQYMGALASHLYDNSVGVLASTQSFGLPVWMNEFYKGSGGNGGDAFDYADKMSQLLSDANVVLVDSEFAFMGQWDSAADAFIQINNSGSNYLGYTVSKIYYTFGQFSRFIPPGSVRVRVASTDQTVKATAYKVGSSVVIVAVNDTGQDDTTTFGGLTGADSVTPTRTSASENWAVLPTIGVTFGTFTATLPAKSVTTFVSGSVVVDPPPPPAPVALAWRLSRISRASP